MVRIMPLSQMRDTKKVSEIVNETKGPVYVTKNGSLNMVLMSEEEYNALIEAQQKKQESNENNGGAK